MTDTWQGLVEQLLVLLGKILEKLIQDALAWSLVIVWLAVSVWGINWKRVWPVLAQGAWVPLALVMVLAALVWSQITPGELQFLSNFWWRLADFGLIVAATLFCGWLQGVLGWQPAEIELEPPTQALPTHGNH